MCKDIRVHLHKYTNIYTCVYLYLCIYMFICRLICTYIYENLVRLIHEINQKALFKSHILTVLCCNREICCWKALATCFNVSCKITTCYPDLMTMTLYHVGNVWEWSWFMGLMKRCPFTHLQSTATCITLGVRVASECCSRATPFRHVYTGGRKHHLAGRTNST